MTSTATHLTASIFIATCLITAPQTALGQQIPEASGHATQPPAEVNIEAAEDVKIEAQGTASPTATPLSPPRAWATIEIALSVAMLIFGALVFGLQTYLIVNMNLQWTPTAILRVQGLTMIIVGSILLIVAGYSNQQILPVIGLFGTIAGYLLGASEKQDAKRVD